MDTSLQQLNVRNARIANAVLLAGFVGYVVVPHGVRVGVVVLILASALVLAACATAWMRTPGGSRTSGWVAIASAAGLLGSMAYLHSLADEPSAIPLVGVFVLLLSLVGLVVSLLLLHERRPVSR